MSQYESTWRIPQWFEHLTDQQHSFLKSYYDDLCKWNPKVNLVSSPTLVEADRIHVADSILGNGILEKHLPQGATVWDLGSGNGFPGIVLSILRPDLKVICVDSDERKSGFLMQLSRRLGFKNVSVRCLRIENIGMDQIQFAINRGLADIGKVLKLCSPLIVPRGTILHFKGIEWKQELECVPDSIKALWYTELLGSYELPGDTERVSREILISTKE